MATRSSVIGGASPRGRFEEMRMKRQHVSAFTLLELMITLAIAATLAGFAVPAYRSHITRTHRIDAASALYRAAQFIEGAASDSASTLPPGLDQAPQFGAPVYRLRMLPADDANGGYTIEATPGESGPMRDDACGIFVLDATGHRGNRSAENGLSPTSNECWNTT
jgi:type IV pilus assembly protein PilE